MAPYRVLLVPLALVLAAPFARAATPVTLTHSGFLLDANDAPLTSNGVAMRFRVHTTASGGVPAWEGNCGSVPVRAGYFSVTLGAGACVGDSGGGLDPVLDTGDLPPGGARWLEFVLDAQVMTPRMALATLPSATLAGRALDSELLDGRPSSDFALAASLASVATSGAYADLTGKPALAPVATSGAYADLTGKPALAPVATSGAYADLTGKPALAPVATSGAYADLTGRPALAPVALSGSYLDLTNKPVLGATDIPNLDASKITSGVFASARIPSGTDATKLPLAGGTMSGAINMSGKAINNMSLPVAEADAATKAYVDAAAGGGGQTCYYVYPESQGCGAGFSKMPGTYQNASVAHGICCSGLGGGTAAFVLTSTTYTGNIGGLAGADAACLSELGSRNWLGKQNFTLVAGKVRAFLCDSGNCNNLKANTTYYFASAADPTAGGRTFSSDSFGRGPNDTASWSGADTFNVGTYFWSNRATGQSTYWNNVPQSANSCSNWTNPSSGTTTFGYTATSGTSRWNWSTDACATSKALICIVDP